MIFCDKSYQIWDDYMTPKHAWEDIKHFIPKDKLIWECFYGDSSSGKNLEDLGFDVIHEDIDFFENDLGEVLISNPPYSKKKEVFTRLKKLEKPFIMICPSSMLNTKYIRNLFADCEDKLKIIIPKKRIQFIKYEKGLPVKDQKNRCNFDTFYFCYKIALPCDINWL